MKKLLLMALLLGLTGCGENNQSDSIKTDTHPIVSNQREALNSQAPIQSSRSAIAPSLRGWTVKSTSPLGSGLIIEAEKLGVSSSALIKPTPADVAKVLRGGAAGIALSIAVDQLLDAVDWVLDPANNQIKYRHKIEGLTKFRGLDGLLFDSAEEYCSWRLNKVRSEKYPKSALRNITYSSSGKSGTCWIYTYSATYAVDFNFEILKNIEIEEKTLPLETVAEQVISNADADSLDAQVATGLAAQSILNEAYNDDAKAEPIANDLERNSKKCPDGRSRNVYGQCFICGSAAVESKMAEDVQIAKGMHIGLGACKVNHTFEGLMLRYNNYVREATARDKLNACYDIPHQTHLDKAKEAWRQAEEVCVEYMAGK
ncbi:hypothetical protein MMP69_12040 [Acinetobacter modestus]|nr:hypothetical protein [Acinetobacter modestus]MCH7333840.1 hypothetical protein [Acinetobacter modestus]